MHIQNNLPPHLQVLEADFAASVRAKFEPFIKQLTVASQAVITPLYRSTGLHIEDKDDATPVTEADKKAEEVIREIIAKQYPQHGVVGEEYGEYQADAEWVWVLDPIDGTLTYIHGIPLFVTLIGLKYRGQPAFGAIHQPILGHLAIGDNCTTTLNDAPVRMRTRTLENATVLLTDTRRPAVHQPSCNWAPIEQNAKLLRTWADGYGYLHAACGWADVAADPILKPWDIMACIPVVRGAGGVITNWQNGPVVSEDGVCSTSSIAACPSLHKHIMQTMHA